MNDTDLIQMPRTSTETCQDVISGLQLSLNTWEGGIGATGGGHSTRKKLLVSGRLQLESRKLVISYFHRSGSNLIH